MFEKINDPIKIITVLYRILYVLMFGIWCFGGGWIYFFISFFAFIKAWELEEIENQLIDMRQKQYEILSNK